MQTSILVRKRRWGALGIGVALLSSLLFFGSHLNSQTFEAQVTGIVRDSSGAVVVNAHLAATNLARGTTTTTDSNQNGVYRFPALPPAGYSIRCELKGFKVFEQKPVTLQVGQVLELNVTLEPGNTGEQVSVTAEPTPLEAADATLGQVVTTRSIENLPLNVRDPMALVGLTPGVTFGPSFGNGGGVNVGRNFFKSDFNVGGGRSGSQEILLDGIPNTTGDSNRAIINPPVDAVQEFKVQANSYNAEFGRTSGGVVNIVTKSGTNDIHGAAYDFERHSVLDASNFFNNRAGRQNPSFQRHQFGGVVGGPIKPNKWFFFGDYEGLRQAYPQTATSTVPTPFQREGDLSQTFAANGRLIQIYDPASLVVLPDGTRRRTQFAGNSIPQSRIDPIAANVMPFFPLPNAAGNPVTGQNNYVYSANSSTNSNKWDIRNDINISDSTRAFVRFSRQEDSRRVPGSLPPAEAGNITNDHYSQAVADVSHVFSSSLLADVQTSFSRALAIQTGGLPQFDVSTLGFPSSFAGQIAPQLPIFSISDTVGITRKSNVGQQFQPRNSWVTRGSINYLRGQHNLKFGGEWRILDFNEYQNANSSGTFNFTRLFTQGPNPVQASSIAGFGVASFLLGTPAAGSVRKAQPISTQGLYYGAFVQDDWRVTNRLTLNLGVRWDLSLGNREKYGRLGYLDLNASSPLSQASGLPDLRGVVDWVGQANSKDQVATNWRNLAPRIGFAYRATSDLVIRGGYGIFFLPRPVQGNGVGALEAVIDTPMLATIDGVTPANTLSNPYPAGIASPLNDRNPLAGIGTAITAPVHDSQAAYTQLWSFGFERQLPAGIVLSANYWGNKGTHLAKTVPINQLPDQYLALGARLNDQVPKPFYRVITTGVLAGPTISRRQSLLPYPQYAGDNGLQQALTPTGNSIYHAATIQAEKRLSDSMTFLAAYTFSKAIDDLGVPLDTYNQSVERALSDFDVTHQVLVSAVYRLPFGKGRRWGSGWSGLENALLGNWDISGILRAQSGEPVSIGRPAVTNGTSARLENPTVNEWFNTSTFSVAQPYAFGNVGPVIPDVRTDAMKNVDTVLVKNFTITLHDHPIQTQLRTEFYNLFNHPQFDAPNGTVSSQNFGQITSQANSPRQIQFGLKVKF